MRPEEKELIERRADREVFNTLVAAKPENWPTVATDTRPVQLGGLWHIHEHRGDQRARTRGWATYDWGQRISWGAAHAYHEAGETDFSTESMRRARLWEAKLSGGVLWRVVDEMRWLSRRWPDDRFFLTEEQKASKEEDMRAAKYRIGEAWVTFAVESLRRREPGIKPINVHYDEVVAHMERFGRRLTRVGLELLKEVVPRLQPR